MGLGGGVGRKCRQLQLNNKIIKKKKKRTSTFHTNERVVTKNFLKSRAFHSNEV